MKYTEYLKSNDWIKKSSNLKRKVKKCQICSSRWDLQVHHNSYKNIGSEKEYDLVVLCKQCHKSVHEKLENTDKEYLLFYLGSFPLKNTFNVIEHDSNRGYVDIEKIYRNNEFESFMNRIHSEEVEYCRPTIKWGYNSSSSFYIYLNNGGLITTLEDMCTMVHKKNVHGLYYEKLKNKIRLYLKINASSIPKNYIERAVKYQSITVNYS